MKLFRRLIIIIILIIINIIFNNIYFNNKFYKNQKLENNNYKKLKNNNYKKLENNNLKQIAFHESGHALIANIFKEYFIIYKVKILKKKENGFIKLFPKNYYKNKTDKKYLLANLIVTMAGYAAETILLNSNTKHLFNYTTKQILPIFNYNMNYNNLKNNSDLLHANKIINKYLTLYNVNYKKIKNIIKIENYFLINYAYKKAIYLLINNYNLLIKISNDILKYNSLNYSYFKNL